MPRPRSLEPQYCLNRTTGRAFVTIDGRRVYLGRHGTPESRDEYRRVLAEWAAAGRPRHAAPAAGGVTVGQVITAFWAHARTAYPAPDYREGKRPTGELGNFWDALRPLRRLYSHTPARDFGPMALKALRGEMVRLGWCRNYVNRQTSRVKLVFKWAVEHELVPGECYARLAAVSGIRRGRHEQVRESA